MTKEQSAFRRFLRKIKVPFLAGNTTAKFLFLLLSVFLWFLIKLSKEGYITEFNFPVEYTNVPEDKRLDEKRGTSIRVRVRSHGFDLLKYRLMSFRPLEIDVANTLRLDGNRYYWDPNDREEFIEAEFDEGIQILSLNPDTVFVEFDDVKSKKVKVYLQGRKLYSNFKTFSSPPEIRPDSIIVLGAAEEVNKMDSIFTKPIDLKAEEDSLIRTVALDLPKKTELEFSAREVSVKLRYTSLTEGTFTIPVKVVNLPDNYEMNIFPKNINLRFQVPVEDYQRVRAEDFEAYVDYRDIIDTQETRFLIVRLQSAPAFLRKVILEPRQLEYILIEK